MATRIAITPQELYDASAQFNQKANEIRDIINYMRQQIASLDGSWEGAAKTQYFVNFDEMGKMLDSIPEGTDNIANVLNNIAKTIVDLDENMASSV